MHKGTQQLLTRMCSLTIEVAICPYVGNALAEESCLKESNFLPQSDQWKILAKAYEQVFDPRDPFQVPFLEPQVQDEALISQPVQNSLLQMQRDLSWYQLSTAMHQQAQQGWVNLIEEQQKLAMSR